MGSLTLVLAALCLISGAAARKGFGPGEQEWDFVKVRPNAHIFWWLYFTTANVKSFYEKPLVIWLQGGPGASSTSYGNFEELGPLDVNLKHRNYTWVKDYNVLFIDNPVGTGFSYVTDSDAYSTTNAQIAKDLVACMKGFLEKLPGFGNVPTYITTESYGGKMGAEFALLWHKEQKAGRIKSNLKGVALGDAWISPIDSVMTWAPFLLSMGMVDSNGYKKIDAAAKQTQKAVENGEWEEATYLWGHTEYVILETTTNIDFYNILSKKAESGSFAFSRTKDIPKPGAYNAGEAVTKASLNWLMNGPVREALGLNRTHGTQSGTVFSRLRGDFMKPAIHIVESLLDETDLAVVVLTGHLDLIVDTPGTLLWVERLKWKHADAWMNSKRSPLIVDNVIEGYVKTHGKFTTYWVNRAGHMVPKDNPAAMARLLEDFTHPV